MGKTYQNNCTSQYKSMDRPMDGLQKITKWYENGMSMYIFLTKEFRASIQCWKVSNSLKIRCGSTLGILR